LKGMPESAIDTAAEVLANLGPQSSPLKEKPVHYGAVS